MALVGSINIAMTCSTQALQKGLNSARSTLSSFGSIATGVMQGAVGTAFMHGMRLAEEFRENVEKLDYAFGDSSESIVEGANSMAEAFGVSKIAYTSLASKLGGTLGAKGVDQDAAADMTKNLLVLGQAIANFKHIGLEEAMGKIQAGLAGRGRGLAEFKIGLNDSSIKAEALAMGLVQVGQKLDPATKAQAAFNLMMREGSGLIDQMGERANDRGNAFRAFWNTLENIQETFAEKLPAPVESFFAQLNVGIVAAQTAWTNWSNDVIGGQNDLMDFGQSSAQSIGMVQKAVGLLANSWQLASAGFHTWQANFNGGLAMITDGLVSLDKWYEANMPTMLGGGKAGSNREFLQNFSEELQSTATKEFEDLKTEWAKPWASEGIDASFDAARKKLHEMRTDVVNNAKASFVPVNPKASAAGKTNAHPFAEASIMGSREAASTILRSKYGIGSDKGMEKIAANSEKSVALQERMADALENLSDNAGDGIESLNSL